MQKEEDMWTLLILPVDTSNTLLYDALDLLEHVGVLFINPVRQISTVIKDLGRKMELK